MKVVTAFDLGALIAQAEFVKAAVAPPPAPAKQPAPTPMPTQAYYPHREMSMNDLGQMYANVQAMQMPWANKGQMQGFQNIRYAPTPGSTIKGPTGLPIHRGYTILGEQGGKTLQLGQLNSKPGSMFAPRLNRTDLEGAIKDGPYGSSWKPTAPTNRVQ